MVKVIRLLTLVSFKRVSLVEYESQKWSLYLLQFKSMSKVEYESQKWSLYLLQFKKYYLQQSDRHKLDAP